MLTVIDRAGLGSEQLAELKTELAELTILQDVIRWGFAQTPPSNVADVVVLHLLVPTMLTRAARELPCGRSSPPGGVAPRW